MIDEFDLLIADAIDHRADRDHKNWAAELRQVFKQILKIPMTAEKSQSARRRARGWLSSPRNMSIRALRLAWWRYLPMNTPFQCICTSSARRVPSTTSLSRLRKLSRERTTQSAIPIVVRFN